jgi:periplasmic protein TonB
MFEHVFVTDTGRTVRPYTVMISFAGQMALVGLGILVPLIYTDTLPNGWWAEHFSMPLVPPGKPTVQPQPKPEPGVPRPRHGNAAARFFEPVNYPPRARTIVDTEVPPDARTSGSPFTVIGGTGLNGGPLSPAIGELAHQIPLPPGPVKPVETAPAQEKIIRVTVGGLVKAPRPLLTPQPIYPEMARRARIEGLVRLQAIIATNGTVQGVQLITGHPWLVAAAIAAVRDWRYTPPTLNGDPVEMVMFVEVNFRLGR